MRPYEAVEALLNGDTRFFTARKELSNYEIVMALSKTTTDFAPAAERLLVQAKARLPMDFDLEAEHLYLRILYAIFRER